jgi:hypothetical protein
MFMKVAPDHKQASSIVMFNSIFFLKKQGILIHMGSHPSLYKLFFLFMRKEEFFFFIIIFYYAIATESYEIIIICILYLLCVCTKDLFADNSSLESCSTLLIQLNNIVISFLCQIGFTK